MKGFHSFVFLLKDLLRILFHAHRWFHSSHAGISTKWQQPDCGSMLEDEEEESGTDEPGTNVMTDLIGQGASLNSQTDRTGETALHLAARYARADAAKRLLDAGAMPMLMIKWAAPLYMQPWRQMPKESFR